MLDQETIAEVVDTASAAAVAVLFYVSLIRPWQLRWGATDAEAEGQLPGDDLVPHPKHQDTHAITINAPLADVWPWLVQVGQTRGGFYSYTWLENLVGCRMHNADRVVREWQNIKVGDEVWLHPKAPPLPVVVTEPGRAIVLGSAGDGQQAEARTSPDAGTWGFFLNKIDDTTTRLIIRSRWERRPGLLPWLLIYLVLEPAH